MAEIKKDWVKFYQFYGVDIDGGSSTESQGLCPWCEKSNLYVNQTTGQFHCKSCEQSGNAYNFLKELHSLSSKSDADYSDLSDNRGIEEGTLRDALIVKSAFTGEWLLPGFNTSGALSNLYKLLNIKGKLRVSSGPGLSHTLYGLHSYNNQSLIYLCEGQWDAMALQECYAHLRPTGGPKHKVNRRADFNQFPKIAFLGLPGATTFKKEWASLFHEKDVVLCPDNDSAGDKMVETFVKRMEAEGYQPKSCKKLVWPKDNSYQGWDIRDLLGTKSWLRTVTFINKSLEEVTVAEAKAPPQRFVDPIPCKTFTELCKHYERELLFTADIKTTLACMLAVVLSTPIKGGQLGLRVIGPPGSAKSTLAECLSQDRKYVYPRSKITGLVTGWQGDGEQPIEQLATKLNNKCLLVKDADTILQLPNRAMVESEIRDALGDGVIRSEYRTGLEVEAQTLFTMILCGTAALRRMDDAILGSRFLDVVIHEADTDTRDVVRKAMDSQFSILSGSIKKPDPNGEQVLKKLIPNLAAPTIGFLDHKMEQLSTEEGFDIEEMTESQKQRVHALADLVSYCRSRVERGQDRTLRYRPEREIGTRLAEQFIRLATFLAIILSPRRKVKITHAVFEILRKVARDTVQGFQFEVMYHLYQADRRSRTPLGLKAEEISGLIKIGKSQVQSIVRDMIELEIVERRSVANGKGQRGRNTDYYILSEEVRDLCKLVL